jgi:hypothetical protein
MEHDEHEMLVEYSEMTAFNFNSKEYKDVQADYMECKKTAQGVEGFFKELVNRFMPQSA